MTTAAETGAPTAAGLMNVRNAAAWLGISERKLWGVTAPRGPLPSVKIGSRVLYRPEDVASYAEDLSRAG